ncbi:MAG: SPOR domain-containing protein [Gammaproteobacteria bacterium]|nr:SPOR domain-containing protein [Gammaproteobacteria bacterium]
MQVGAFTNRFNAEVVYNRLTGAGFAPVAIQEVLIGKSRIFRVRVGPVESITQGDQLIDRMYGYGMREQRLVID